MRYNVHKIKHRNHILSITKIVLFLLFIFSFVMLATQILKVRHEQNAFLSLATLVSETEQDFLLNKTNDNMYKQAAAEDREQPLQQYEDIYEMNPKYKYRLSCYVHTE